MASVTRYGPGTAAKIDGFGGLISCTVLRVLKPGASGRIIGHQELEVHADESRGGYMVGEIFKCSAAYTPPRKQIRLRDQHYRIDVNYCYTEHADVTTQKSDTVDA